MRRRWECPCGNFVLTAWFWVSDDRVDLELGRHYLECVVAQAEVGLRLLVDGPPKRE